MVPGRSFLLSELARGLGVPQHRLIHLCEKGVVEPELGDAAGRGSSRRFSARNYLELAVALRMRELMVPVATIGAVLHTLREFERVVQRELPAFELPGSLRAPSAPDLRVIVGDGRVLYFSLGGAGGRARLFGGIPLDELEGNGSEPVSLQALDAEGPGALGPEGSRFGRLELSLTEVARSLALD